MNEQQNRWDELAGELAGTDYAHAPESTQTAIDRIIKLEVKENRERASETSCLLDALEAVEKLHRPVTLYELDPLNGTWVYDESDERKVMAVLCSECTPDFIIEEVDDSQYDGPNDIDVSFPCPTVKAIREALEIQP